MLSNARVDAATSGLNGSTSGVLGGITGMGNSGAELTNKL